MKTPSPQFLAPASSRLAVLCLSLLAAQLSLSAHAANKWWDIDGATAGAGGTAPAGNWDTTTANWTTDSTGSSAATTFATGDAAIFAAGNNATGSYTVTLPSALTAGSVTVEEGTVTKAGSALTTQTININSGATLLYNSSGGIAASAGGVLTLNGTGATFGYTAGGAGGTFLTANMGIVLNGGGTLSDAVGSPNIYSGVISGTGDLTKTGAGTLSITTTCTYSGSTRVNNGVLRLRTGTPQIPNTDLIVTSPGGFDAATFNQTIQSLSGTGNLPFSGSGTLTIAGTSSTTFSGVWSGSGRINVNKSGGTGTLTLNGVNTASGKFTLTAGTVTVNAGKALCGPICDVIINGGTLNLNNTTQTIEDLSGTGGTINLVSGLALTSDPVTSTTCSSTIAGAGGLTRLNANATIRTLTLNGANTYSGNTVITKGIIAVGSATALGSAAGYTDVASGGEVLFTGATTTFNCAEPFRIAGVGAGDNGAIAVTASAAPTISGPITLTGDASVTVSSSASATFNNPAAFTSLANQSLTIRGGANAAGVKLISGAINLGTGQLIKLEGGTWALSAANSYSGGTFIAAGTLDAQLAGALGTGNVTVTNTGRLVIDAAGAIDAGATLIVNDSGSVSNYTGSTTIHALSIGGVQKAAGTWGSATSGATHVSSLFTGNGVLNVTTGPTSSIALSSSADPAVYGNVSFTATVTGTAGTPTGTVLFKEGANVLGTAPIVAGTATFNPGSTLAPGGPYSITAEYSGDNNFGPSTSTAISQTVSGATLTAVPHGVDKQYDGNATATVTFTDDHVAGDTLTYSYTASFADATIGTAKPVTVSGIAISGPNADRYTLASTAGSTTADIVVATLTVSNIWASDKVYDGNTAAVIHTNDAVLLGVVAGEDVSLVFTNGIGTFANKNAGTDKTVQISGLEIVGADVAKYVLTQPATNATITPANLTESATGVNKVYDGSLAATATFTDDRIAGDTLTVSYTATFADKLVGVAKPVSVSGIALSGADAGNYTLTATTASTVADITVRPLNVSAIGIPKTYDGTAVAGATLSDDKVSGDDVSESFASAAFADKNVGVAKPIVVNGIAVAGGTDAANYTLVNTTANATANITTRTLSVSATANNKVYDGTTAATVALSNDKLGTDDVADSYTSAAFADKHVGSGKTVTVNGISISGGDAGNYILASATASTAADITARALTVSATGINKTYDATTVAAVTLSSDKVTGDTVTANYTSAAFADKVVGTAKAVTVSGISITGADASNYTLAATTASTTADITAAALSVTGLSAQDKSYDGTTSATLTGTAALSTGVVSGEDVSLAGTASATFDNKNVGTTKPITVTGYTLAGADINNYTLAQPSGLTANITAVALTVTGLTANNKPYDGTAVATLNGTATLSTGVVGTEDVTLAGTASATFDTKNAGAAKPVTVTGYALAGADIGNYTLAQPAGLTADITAIALTVTGVTANNKTYDGTATATLNGTAALSTGVVGTEDVTLAGTASATFDNKNVGTAKPVTVAGYTLAGADIGNYTLAQPAGLAANITAIALNVTGVTADNKTYDTTATATLSGTAVLSAGVVSGEDVNLSGTASAAFDNANVGTAKPVTVTGYTLAGADIGNYTLAQPAGLTADITPAASTTVVASSQNPSTNGSSVTFTATVSSSAGTPTGSVVFLTNGVALGSVALSGGSASINTADLPVGTITVAAQYAAQDNWQASSDSLSQVVYSAVTLSTTNVVLSLVDNGSGLFTLNCLGTPGARYYVVAGSDLTASLSSWTALAGSTNTAATPSGLWSFQVSNAAPAFYRSVAINPAP